MNPFPRLALSVGLVLLALAIQSCALNTFLAPRTSQLSASGHYVITQVFNGGNGSQASAEESLDAHARRLCQADTYVKLGENGRSDIEFVGTDEISWEIQCQ